MYFKLILVLVQIKNITFLACDKCLFFCQFTAKVLWLVVLSSVVEDNRDSSTCVVTVCNLILTNPNGASRVAMTMTKHPTSPEFVEVAPLLHVDIPTIPNSISRNKHSILETSRRGGGGAVCGTDDSVGVVA